MRQLQSSIYKDASYLSIIPDVACENLVGMMYDDGVCAPVLGTCCLRALGGSLLFSHFGPSCREVSFFFAQGCSLVNFWPFVCAKVVNCNVVFATLA